jgi:hypothetical protein
MFYIEITSTKLPKESVEMIPNDSPTFFYKHAIKSIWAGAWSIGMSFKVTCNLELFKGPNGKIPP